MSGDYVAVPWSGAGDAHPMPAPSGFALRGFGLYVGLDQTAADAAGVDIGALLGEVRRRVEEVPGASSFASVVLAPSDASDIPLEVVRTALAEPSHQHPAPPPSGIPNVGIVVDLARHRVTVDGQPVSLSFREHALLRFLVEHQGEVHDRQRLRHALAGETHGDPISARTIDVYLQRLRRRLHPYGDVVRTVRGHGYRLDPHPDVRVVRG